MKYSYTISSVLNYDGVDNFYLIFWGNSVNGGVQDFNFILLRTYSFFSFQYFKVIICIHIEWLYELCTKI